MTKMSDEELRQLRGFEIAMVYQEPMASLNPSLLIGRQLMEVPLCHEKVTEAEARQRAAKMLAAVTTSQYIRTAVLKGLPQKPYIPIGTLKEALCQPDKPDAHELSARR